MSEQMRSVSEQMRAIGLSLKGQYLLLDDDRTLPVVSILDANGAETRDLDAAVGIIFRRPDGNFGVQLVQPFRDEDLIIKDDG